MSEIAYTVVANPWDASGIKIVQWAGLTVDDTGTPYACGHYSDKCIQVKGTMGAGGNCRIQGTNDISSETWATLNDPQGNALDVTAAKIEQVLENPYKIRPNITAGDETTSITITMLISTTR